MLNGDERHHGGGDNLLRRLAVAVALVMIGTVAWAVTPGPQQRRPIEQWKPRSMPAGTEFVGDQVCAGCHTSRVANQLQTSMAMAMESVADSKVLSTHPRMTFQSGPYSYEIKRDGKQSIYSVTDGKETISLPITNAFGQGKAGQTYVLQYEGAFYESLVSYYREIGGLDFTIGAPRGIPSSLKNALGRRMSDNETMNCFSCHSTGGISGGKIHLEKVVPGVRCEACHGPGGEHAAAGKASQPNAKLIFNPRRLSGDELAQEFCASCHRGNEDFALIKSLEINNVRFQPYRIFQSKCYSDDRRITCTACHNPHEQLKEDAAFYDAKCMACHSTKQKTVGQADSNATAPDMAPACPVKSKDCASCHMPRLGPPAAHFKFTDHYIRIVRPSEAYPN